MASFVSTTLLAILALVAQTTSVSAGVPDGHGHGPPSYPTYTHGPPYQPSCPAASTPVRATATISAGVIIGTTTSLPSASATVNKFLGVPFAMSPPERFSPPQSAGRFSGVIQATAWKPACIQQFVCGLLVLIFLVNSALIVRHRSACIESVRASSLQPAPPSRKRRLPLLEHLPAIDTTSSRWESCNVLDLRRKSPIWQRRTTYL